MSYGWRPEPGPWSEASLKAADLLPRFATQQQAEEWLTQHYEELLDEEVLEVSLIEDDQQIYGPMSLEP